MKKNIIRCILILFAVVIALVIKGPGPNNQINALLSVASFFFGIFVAFSTANSHSRFTKIIDNLKDDEGALLFISYASRSFGSEVQNKIRMLIDSYLIAQIDYRLIDYDKSSSQLEELTEYVFSLKTEGKGQEEALSKMTDTLKEMIINRKQTEVAISQPLSKLEWGTILTLLPVIIGSIYYINTGTVLSIVTSALLTTVALLLIFVLQDIDSLNWNEGHLIWKSLSNTFIKLGLLPYFPDTPLLRGSVALEDLPVNQKVRIGIWHKPYPDISGKEVKIMENGSELRGKTPSNSSAPWVEK